MRRKNGLTLIELMVTLAITAILVTAALGAITTLTRLDKADQARDEATSIAPRVRTVLETDLTHAKRFATRDSGFVLQTVAAVKADSMELEHLPTTVTYTVRQVAGRQWLVRSQRSEIGSDCFTELVAPDISGIQIASEADRNRAKQRWQALGPKTTVTVTFDTGGRVPAAFVFAHE